MTRHITLSFFVPKTHHAMSASEESQASPVRVFISYPIRHASCVLNQADPKKRVAQRPRASHHLPQTALKRRDNEDHSNRAPPHPCALRHGGSTDGVCRDELDFSGLPVRARLHRRGCRWLG